MDISIGMKKERMKEFAQELLAASESEHPQVTIYGADGDEAEWIFNFDNEDMERPEIDAGQIFVEVND